MIETESEDRRSRANAARDARLTSEVMARRGGPRVNLSVRLGPMVHFEVEGENCTELADALQGFQRLNQLVDEMFSDLANRVYPDGDATGDVATDAAS